LAGIKVVDLGRVIAAPFCAMLLGDMGADVLKVEPPGGDPVRSVRPAFANGIPGYFANVNRNKRSVVLDLRAAADMARLRALLADADVLVENFRAGVLEEMGFDDAALAREFPRLVVVRVSAFGDVGPWATRPGVDQIVQGVAGMMAVTGTAESGPLRHGFPLADLFAAVFGALGAVAALHERATSGKGQVVRGSLLEASLAVATVYAGKLFAGGDDPKAEGNQHPSIAPYGLFETADGAVQIMVMHDRHFAAFAPLCGHPEWVGDARFATMSARSENRLAVIAAVGAAMRQRTTAEWLAALEAADIPCGPVLSLAEAFAHPQAQALNMVLEEAGMKMPGFPLRFSRTPMALHRPPPQLGQHQDEI
jgi:crotonobetainyl-CoA:carnitine CoA-transferase CaiB-like acyl-CoA transferase